MDAERSVHTENSRDRESPALPSSTGPGPWRPRLRWFAAEYAVVVAGVLTALATTNWNDGRLTRQSELALLRQIRSELRNDSTDAHGNIEYLRSHRAYAISLRSHLERGLPYTDSVGVYLGALRRNVQHRFTTAAYQTLKARGLEVVSNDSLRFALAQLYDGDYVWATTVVDAVVRVVWIERGHPLLGQRLRQDDLFGPATPRNYAVLARDPEFIAYIDDYIGVISWTLPTEEALAKRIDVVAASIDREIARRE